MSYGKEIFRPKYKETMDSLNVIKDNYFALDQEYQFSSKEKDKEIERLQSIINELEKWLNEEYEATIFDYQNAIEDVLNKLKELKGSENSE